MDKQNPCFRGHGASVAALVVVAIFAWASPSSAATSGVVNDAIGDVTYYAADLGTTTVTINDDGAIAVNTRIVPRPPAGWGGCAYYVGFFPYQTCIPSNMNVTWYLDFRPGAGSLSDGGADAKVLAVPSRGTTTWESDRWDAANGRFVSGAVPAAAEDPGGVTWTLRLGDLDIRRPATIRLRIVSTYKSYTGTGVLLDYTDVAGPGSIPVAGPPKVAGPSRACSKAASLANTLARQIKATERSARRGSRSARRRLRRLRAQRASVLKTIKKKCAKPARGPAPTSAPAGCRLVTKPVFVLEGFGSNAKYVLREQVVVDCTR